MHVSTCRSKSVNTSSLRLCCDSIYAPTCLFLELQLLPSVREQIIGPLLHTEQALQDLARLWDISPPLLEAYMLLSSGTADPALDEISKAFRIFTFCWAYSSLTFPFCSFESRSVFMSIHSRLAYYPVASTASTTFSITLNSTASTSNHVHAYPSSLYYDPSLSERRNSIKMWRPSQG